MQALLGVGIYRTRHPAATDEDLETFPLPSPTPPRSPRRPMPYDEPPSSGRCCITELPDEVLSDVFLLLDLPELTRCMRLCKSIHNLITDSAAIQLHHTLLANSLRLNPGAFVPHPDRPHQLPQTSASLLATLQSRLNNLRKMKPASTTTVRLPEAQGSLYEYLEGVLLQSMSWRLGRGNELVVYDFRKAAEWKDWDEATDEERLRLYSEATNSQQEIPKQPKPVRQWAPGLVQDLETGDGDIKDLNIRTAYRFPFRIHEFAVDPGQDLLVIVELKERLRQPGEPRVPLRSRSAVMLLHLLSLATFQPHPRAKSGYLEWPNDVNPSIHLDFQICDDGLFVLHKRGGLLSDGTRPDSFIGWQWTTGRQVVTLDASPAVSFQSFVLLSPSSFVIPTVHVRLTTEDGILEDLDDGDLDFTHHLQLFAFPPLKTLDNGNLNLTPYPATHVATIDLPAFQTDLRLAIPPPIITVRTDPPPRHTLPTHPTYAPAGFCPEPESGIAIFSFYCQLPAPLQDPHYVMITQKTTLLRYMPAPTSPLLTQRFARPAPVVPFEKIAADVRFFGPNCALPSWVCYVYQNRYVTTDKDNSDSDDDTVVLRRDPNEPRIVSLYDFDPMRVRKERLSRAHQHPFDAPPVDSLEGEVDGIDLTLSETVVPAGASLRQVVRTGSNLPFMVSHQTANSDSPLLDEQRLLTLRDLRRGRAIDVRTF